MQRQLTFDLAMRPALGRGDFMVSPSNAAAPLKDISSLIAAFADDMMGQEEIHDLQMVIQTLKHECEAIGLSFNLSKCFILWLHDQDPSAKELDGLERVEAATGFRIKRAEGHKILGAPIGSDNCSPPRSWRTCSLSSKY